jgi:hypothetical protein
MAITACRDDKYRRARGVNVWMFRYSASEVIQTSVACRYTLCSFELSQNSNSNASKALVHAYKFDEEVFQLLHFHTVYYLYIIYNSTKAQPINVKILAR